MKYTFFCHVHFNSQKLLVKTFQAFKQQSLSFFFAFDVSIHLQEIYIKIVNGSDWTYDQRMSKGTPENIL